MTLDELEDLAEVASQPEYEAFLKTRAAARALIWTDGVLPNGAPAFDPALSQRIRQHGLALLDVGLQILELGGNRSKAEMAFLAAAQSLESLSAKGSDSPHRDFDRFLAACAYHLGRYAARAFSMLSLLVAEDNLSASETLVSQLIRRDLRGLDARLADILASSDLPEDIVESVSAKEDADAALADHVLHIHIARALAFALLAFAQGQSTLIDAARARLDAVEAQAFRFQLVDIWWLARICRFLVLDLWTTSLHVQLPGEFPTGAVPLIQSNPISVLIGEEEAGLVAARAEAFNVWWDKRGLFVAALSHRKHAELELWPSQLGAVKIIFGSSENAVISLPTSAGKTRIAELAILSCLAAGRKVVFVTPLRALSAQTEASLITSFSPLGATVSSLYGSMGSAAIDDDLIKERDILVATPEKLDFALRNDPDLLNAVGLIVLDEGHMIGLTEREVRYEIQIQRLLTREDAATRRVLCLSAVLPKDEKMEDFVGWLSTDSENGLITADWRATEQQFGTVEWNNGAAKLNIQVGGQRPFVPNYLRERTPPVRKFRRAFPRDQKELVLATAWKQVADGQTVLIFHPMRRTVETMAAHIIELRRRGLLADLPEVDPSIIADCLTVGEETLGPDSILLACLRLGIAVHHGSLPTAYRRALETAMRVTSFPVTIASPTLAQGLNLSATTLIFQGLRTGRVVMKPSEFRNVVGRAGRAFVDLRGLVLLPMFEPNRRKRQEWNNLLSAAGDREMESGLLLLVHALVLRIRQQTGIADRAGFEAYLFGQTAWDFAPMAGEVEDELDRARDTWERQIQMLDTALLALLGAEDIRIEDLAAKLDELLASSLWTRRLARQSKGVKFALTTGLIARSRHVWERTTATQRRAYFLAGVGLSTGVKMDAAAEDVIPQLIAANVCIAGGDADGAVAAVTEMARLIFAIPPFVPHKLEKWTRWPEILSGWLRGQSMGELRTAFGEEVTNFIDHAFVYALPWGIEAMRVRAIAHDQPIGDGFLLDDVELSRALPCIETGTLNSSAALLMKSGLALRSAAIAAAERTEASLDSLRDVQRWLKSEVVIAAEVGADWPVPGARQLWLNFKDSFYATRYPKWTTEIHELPVTWFAGAPPPGPLRLIQTDGVDYVALPDYQRVGRIDAALLNLSNGVPTLVLEPTGQVKLTYRGPSKDIIL